MTLDNSARTAMKKGSPIELVWPANGAIALYSPIAVVKASDEPAAADSFVDFACPLPGQTPSPERAGSRSPGRAPDHRRRPGEPGLGGGVRDAAGAARRYRAIFGG